LPCGRRKPSLKLVAKLADTLGLDRHELLVVAHPEAKALIVEQKPEIQKEATSSWHRFIQNQELLACYGVTDRDLHALEHLSFLGTVQSTKEFLAI
jgi:hypothetical protein